MTPPKKPIPRPRPWEQKTEGDGGSFGSWLRRQREAREISLREIAEASKISLRYLEALEEDHFDVLPAPVFARGFLREYSKIVGLDADEVVNNYLAAQQSSDGTADIAEEEAGRPKGQPRDWGYGLLFTLAVVVLLGLAAVLAFWAERRRENAPPPATPLAPPPVIVTVPPPTTAVTPPPAANSPLRVTIDFSEDCWIEIAADGKPRTSELRVRGESLEIEAKQSVVLTLGNPGGVKVEVNDHPFALPPSDGKVLHDVRIDLATAKDLGVSTGDVPRTLAEEVLVPGNQKLQLLAAQGLLPLPPDELLPIQIALAQSSDGEVAEQARASLGRIDPRIAAPYLAHQASSEALAYFAFSVHHPVVQEAIIRRRDVPWMLLEDLASRISPDLQEALLIRQDAIIEHPAILDSLANNPNLSSYSRRRISEYREHLLPRAAIPSIESEIEEANDAEVAAAIASVQDLPTAGEVDDQTGLSEAQVRQLPLPVRLRLTRGASRSLRAILVRDTNALVALSVINNNPLSDQEVEHIARNRSVCEDVLIAITRRREWMRKYPIIQALVGNPRTPPGNSVKLLPMLSVRDLRNLAKDKNVSDLVRRTATRLYKIKQV